MRRKFFDSSKFMVGNFLSCHDALDHDVVCVFRLCFICGWCWSYWPISRKSMSWTTAIHCRWLLRDWSALLTNQNCSLWWCDVIGQYCQPIRSVLYSVTTFLGDLETSRNFFKCCRGKSGNWAEVREFWGEIFLWNTTIHYFGFCEAARLMFMIAHLFGWLCCCYSCYISFLYCLSWY